MLHSVAVALAVAEQHQEEVPMTTNAAATENTFRRPEGVKVTFRRMRFPFEDAGFDRYWLDGSPFKSLFWSQLSTAFDAGEKFFIDSARAMRTEIQNATTSSAAQK